MRTRWEYLFVTAEWEGEWRLRWKNETEIADWKKGPNIYAAVDALGDDGWEMIATPDWEGAPDSHARRMVFKRPKE